jgi:hypothetical protein
MSAASLGLTVTFCASNTVFNSLDMNQRHLIGGWSTSADAGIDVSEMGPSSSIKLILAFSIACNSSAGTKQS